MTGSYINTECKRYGCIKNLLACYANCRYSGRCDELKNELMDKSEQATKDINSYLNQRGRAPITIQIQKRGVKFIDAAKVQTKRQPRALINSPDKTSSAGSRSDVRPRRKTIKRKRTATAALSPEPVTLNAKSQPKVGPAKPPVHKRAKSTRVTAEKKTDVRDREVTKKRKTSARKSRSKMRTRSGKETLMPKRNARPTGATAIEKDSSSMASAEGQNVTRKKSARSTSASGQKKKTGARSSSRAQKSKVFIILEGDRATLVDERGLMSHLLSGGTSKARYFEASEVEARVQIIAKK